jgi:hypothetical protein
MVCEFGLRIGGAKFYAKEKKNTHFCCNMFPQLIKHE